MISGCGLVRIPGNTSILGIGSNSGFTKTNIKITTTSNVIIRNLKFYSAMAESDLVSIEKATKIWVDHCEFHNDGIVGGKDDYDGLLDIVLGSDFITVSWSKFFDHVGCQISVVSSVFGSRWLTPRIQWKGSLIGSSDGTGATDTGKFHGMYLLIYL